MKQIHSNLEYLQELHNYQLELELQNEQLRQTQQELQISKQEYQELYDLAPMGYLLINENGLILKANLTSATLFGLERGKIVQTLFMKFIFSEDQDLFYRHRKFLSNNKTSQVIELKLVKSDGTYFWANLESSYAYDLEGHSIFRIVIIDITSKKNAELKTIEEQRKFSNLIYALNQSAIVSILNPEGNLIFANDKFYQLSGYTKEELLGFNNQVFRSIFHEVEFFEKLPSLLSANNIWRDVICKTKKDGTSIWLDCTITLIPENADQSRYIAIYYDISARILAEQLLINSAKMASLGEMASGIAHEINNPLAIITGKTNQIKRLFTQPILNTERVFEEINKIEATSFRISNIVKSLRSISRNADNDSVEISPLKSIIMETLELCNEKFRHNGVHFEIGEIYEIELPCRPTQISQVLLNLLNNAYDAISNLSIKWIRLEMRIENSNMLQLVITDSGLGISKEIADKILLPFFTTKPVNQGTGLGLSISQKIIQDHKGKLYLDKNSVNTCFIVELPLNQTQFLGEEAYLH